ncbi:hypothetical protein AWC38_SpisGene24558 [Stylophora pistillata]|uniref:Dynamin stalk domain-containing protein n=1 Tax=Stylophora pistillata TaxID=50429 RepID=A0A2B4R554_STYPI|nr:hypothetical protein AWC38_SpisGene24558 [Stylophora pistillata]
MTDPSMVYFIIAESKPCLVKSPEHLLPNVAKLSKFGVVLDFIQSMIGNDTLRKAFNFPHLVLVGRQNMAKTTLINRLIGRYLLPMRRGKTANTLEARTTYPIILNLRNGKKRLVEVKCEIPGVGGTVEDPDDTTVETFLNDVAAHLPKEMGTPISKIPVNVTLQELEDSEIPETSEGKGAGAMKLKENLIRELNKLLFNNTSDMAGGERVRQLFNSFHQEVFKVDPLETRNDDEIRRQQRKLEGVAAPLGNSSENSQLLQRLLYEKYTGFNANGKPVTLSSPVDQLLPLSEKLVRNVETTLRDIVQKAIEQTFSKFPTLKQAVEAKVVSLIFDKKRDQTTEFIRQFLEMQKKSTDIVFAPIPTSQEISNWEAFPLKDPRKPHPCMTSNTLSHMKYLAENLYPEKLLKEIEGSGSQYYMYKVRKGNFYG